MHEKKCDMLEPEHSYENLSKNMTYNESNFTAALSLISQPGYKQVVKYTNNFKMKNKFLERGNTSSPKFAGACAPIK